MVSSNGSEGFLGPNLERESNFSTKQHYFTECINLFLSVLHKGMVNKSGEASGVLFTQDLMCYLNPVRFSILLSISFGLPNCEFIFLLTCVHMDFLRILALSSCLKKYCHDTSLITEGEEITSCRNKILQDLTRESKMISFPHLKPF